MDPTTLARMYFGAMRAAWARNPLAPESPAWEALAPSNQENIVHLARVALQHPSASPRELYEMLERQGRPPYADIERILAIMLALVEPLASLPAPQATAAEPAARGRARFRTRSMTR